MNRYNSAFVFGLGFKFSLRLENSLPEVKIGSRGQTAAGLAFSPDPQQQFLYVANLGNSQIVILNRKTLETAGTFGSAGSGPGQFQTLHHLAVDSKGNIYTAEIGRGRRAQKLVKR